MTTFADDTSYIELSGLLQHSIVCYNEAVEIIEGKNIFDDTYKLVKISSREEQLKEALFRLELCDTLLDERRIKAFVPQKHGNNGSIIENIRQIKAEVLLLYGNLIGWKDCTKAHQAYEDVVHKWNDKSYEGWLQYARSTWDLSENVQDAVIIEKYLKRAMAIQEAEAKNNKQKSEIKDDIFEAKRLYCRLLSQTTTTKNSNCNNNNNTTKNTLWKHLNDLGFRYKFVGFLTTQNFSRNYIKRTRKINKRITNNSNKNLYVGVVDHVFKPNSLRYITNLFSNESSFWHENLYGSPSKGYFSFQLSLIKQPKSSTFIHILHHIWQLTALQFPAVSKAKYCEWWAHSRRHTSGHTLHYDYVVDNGNVPRHPIVSSIFFISANCGNATFVLDQTMETEKTTEGYLLLPAPNRLAYFDGRHLHCVLPGVGPTPNRSEERRITMMVAFWEENPNATKMIINDTDKKGSSSSSGGGGGGGKNITTTATTMVTTTTTTTTNTTVAKTKKESNWVDSFNINNDIVNKEIVENNTRHFVNKDGIIHVDKILEKIPSYIENNELVEPPKKKLKKSTRKVEKAEEIHHIDLLRSDVFSNFGALNSGMYIADPSFSCSLNCNGTCDICVANAK